MKSAHLQKPFFCSKALTVFSKIKKFPTLDLFLKISFVLFLLFLFLVGIKILENSFAYSGNEIVGKLLNVTSNPFISLMAGMFATVLVQSSSVTTSIIVGLVSVGSIQFSNAIPMIMGANIGTTVTNTLVSMGHIKQGSHFQRAFAAATIHDFFNILTVLVLLPIELIFAPLSRLSIYVASHIHGATSVDLTYPGPLKSTIQPVAKTIEDFFVTYFHLEKVTATFTLLFVAGAIIFITLAAVVSIMNSIVTKNNHRIFENKKFQNEYFTIFLGFMITVAVQSSSITTSLLVPLAATGVLNLGRVYALTIGANIGTTTTALIASLTGNILELSIALVHLFFNLFGLLIWFVHPSMRKIPLLCANLLSKGVQWNRLIGPLYVMVLFFVIPLLCLVLSW